LEDGANYDPCYQKGKHPNVKEKVYAIRIDLSLA
jgi:hypothetical protein